MDALLVGGLTAAVTVAAMLLWLLFARPESLISLWSDPAPGGWFEENDGTLQALRVTGSVVVAVLGLLTGLAITFLSGTA